jgi:hypothetical protein
LRVLLRAAANITWLPDNFPLKVSAVWLHTESNFRLPNRLYHAPEEAVNGDCPGVSAGWTDSIAFRKDSPAWWISAFAAIDRDGEAVVRFLRSRWT